MAAEPSTAQACCWGGTTSPQHSAARMALLTDPGTAGQLTMLSSAAFWDSASDLIPYVSCAQCLGQDTRLLASIKLA